MDGTVAASDSAAGWVAIALAVVTAASVLMLVAFYIVGGPLGLINDAGNGLIGVLSAVLYPIWSLWLGRRLIGSA